MTAAELGWLDVLTELRALARDLASTRKTTPKETAA